MKDQGEQFISSNSHSRCKGTTRSGAAPLGTAGAPGKLPRGTRQGSATAAARCFFPCYTHRGRIFYFFFF